MFAVGGCDFVRGPMPLIQCGRGESKIGERSFVTKDLIEGGDDVFARTPRETEVTEFERALIGALIAFGDIVKELGVASTPSVDGLFGVAYLEEGALTGRILDGFVDEIFNDGPLQMRGVLKFIEEPMICLLYTSPSPRDQRGSRMPSSA